MKVPRPRDGWRVFAGEVGVIVLGVLIALGAQEMAGRARIEADVSTFRRTVDHEIAYNLWVYQHRQRQSACTTRRLALFSQWLDGAGDGQQAEVLSSGERPLAFSLYRSVWDNRDAEVFAALPADARRDYAQFYDELANNQINAIRERETWLRFLPYEVRGPLTLDDRRTLHQTIRTAAGLNDNVKGNLVTSFEIARSLGITARQPPGMTPQDRASGQVCPPAP